MNISTREQIYDLIKLETINKNNSLRRDEELKLRQIERKKNDFSLNLPR